MDEDYSSDLVSQTQSPRSYDEHDKGEEVIKQEPSTDPSSFSSELISQTHFPKSSDHTITKNQEDEHQEKFENQGTPVVFQHIEIDIEAAGTSPQTRKVIGPGGECTEITQDLTASVHKTIQNLKNPEGIEDEIREYEILYRIFRIENGRYYDDFKGILTKFVEDEKVDMEKALEMAEHLLQPVRWTDKPSVDELNDLFIEYGLDARFKMSAPPESKSPEQLEVLEDLKEAESLKDQVCIICNRWAPFYLLLCTHFLCSDHDARS